MEVLLAKTAGFCFGVKRAVDKVYEQIEKNSGQIYTYGPIIHNQEVVDDLKNKGVKVLNNINELKEIEDGTVVIRSHGVSKDIYDIINEKKLTLIDATCPFVKKIHKIVEKESKQGKHIVIIGDSSHPEVQGIKGWADGSVTIINNEAEAEEFQLQYGEKICIVAQTTYNYKRFKKIVEIISNKDYNCFVIDTVCDATYDRQAEAKCIASKVDAMLVIGDKHSSNTQKLFEICKKECNNTYHVQTLADLYQCELRLIDNIGITAGASTPNNIIEEVYSHVRIKF